MGGICSVLDFPARVQFTFQRSENSRGEEAADTAAVEAENTD
jgi:hypothetical protein